MPWVAIGKFRYARRGAAGAEAIPSALEVQLSPSASNRISQGAAALPQRSLRTAERCQVRILCEAHADFAAHLGKSGVELLVVGYATTAGNFKIQPHVEAAGYETVLYRRPEGGGEVTVFGLLFDVVGVNEAATLATELAESSDT